MTAYTPESYSTGNRGITRRTAIVGLLGLVGTLYADTSLSSKKEIIAEAKPAPKDLESKAQKLFEQKSWECIEVTPMGPCTDSNKRPLIGCPEECPKENIFGMMKIDGVQYHFQASEGRVLTLHGKDPVTVYDIYWWNPVKNRKRDGPYKYDHDSKRWFKIEPWWLQKK